MNKIVIALITLVMLAVAGCAAQQAAMKDAVKTPVASGTSIDLGDPSPLPDIAPYDDEPLPPLM